MSSFSEASLNVFKNIKPNDEITPYINKNVSDTSFYGSDREGQRALLNHILNAPDSISVEALTCVHGTVLKQGGGLRSLIGSSGFRKRFTIIVGGYLYYYSDIDAFMDGHKHKKNPIFLQNYMVSFDDNRNDAWVQLKIHPSASPTAAPIKLTGESSSGGSSFIQVAPHGRVLTLRVPHKYALKWKEGIQRASTAASILRTYQEWNTKWMDKTLVNELDTTVAATRKKFDTEKDTLAQNAARSVLPGNSWTDFADNTATDQEGWKQLVKFLKGLSLSACPYAARLNPNAIESVFSLITSHICGANGAGGGGPNNTEDASPPSGGGGQGASVFTNPVNHQACLSMMCMLIGQAVSPSYECTGGKISLDIVRRQALTSLVYLIGSTTFGFGSYYFLQAGGLEAFSTRMFWNSVQDDCVAIACMMLEGLVNDGSKSTITNSSAQQGDNSNGTSAITIIPPTTLAPSCLRLALLLVCDAAPERLRNKSVAVGAFPAGALSVLRVCHLLAYGAFVRNGGSDRVMELDMRLRMEAARGTVGAVDSGRAAASGLHRLQCAPFPELANSSPSSLDYEAKVKNVKFAGYQRELNNTVKSAYVGVKLVTAIVNMAVGTDISVPKLPTFSPELRGVVTDEDGNEEIDDAELARRKKQASVTGRAFNAVTVEHKIDLA